MTKRVENSVMGAEISAATVAEDMRAAVMAAAGKPEWGETLERMFWRASQRLGISERRARAFWRREAKAITYVEYMTVMQRLDALKRRQAEGHALHTQTAQAIAETRALLAGEDAAGGERGDAGGSVQRIRNAAAVDGGMAVPGRAQESTEAAG